MKLPGAVLHRCVASARRDNRILISAIFHHAFIRLVYPLLLKEGNFTRHPSSAQKAYYAGHDAGNKDGLEPGDRPRHTRAREHGRVIARLCERDPFILLFSFFYLTAHIITLTRLVRSMRGKNGFAYKVTNSSCPSRTSLAFL